MEIVNDALKTFVPEHARGIKILVVDDHVSSLFHITNMLEQYSYNVTPTTSTSYALFLVHEMEHPFDLVIAYYNVADMISLSFLRTMLQKDISVIFLFSGANDHRDVIKVLSAGAHSFLMKPVAPVHLKYVWQTASIKMLERIGKERSPFKKNIVCESPLATAENNGSGQGERRSKRKRSRSVKRRKTEAIRIKRSGSGAPRDQQIQIQSQVVAQGSTMQLLSCPTVNLGTYPVVAQQEGIVDRLTSVLLEQDPEELGFMLDPHLVDQYCNFFKS